MILGILQARMTSSRLPGKVLKPILGKPMLERHIERILRAKNINELIVATSDDSTDDGIADLCENINIACFRGSLLNVLDRFHAAAKLYAPQHVVRLTGDCPLADPMIIDKVIDFHIADDFDYVSNTLQPTFPHGLDVEVMRWSVLQEAWLQATLPPEKEHVTYFIYHHPERFKLGGFKNSCDLSHFRWTVDEPEDYELVKRIYEILYPQKTDFLTDDIIELLKEMPELSCVNAKHRCLRKSVVESCITNM